MESHELAIVGGGPVGLYAALIAKLYDIDFILLEAGREFGGQVTALYPTKPVEDVPSLVNSRGIDIIDNLLEQLKEHNINSLRTDSRVIDIVKQDNGFVLKIEGREDIFAKAVLLAIGFGEVSPKKLNVPGEKEFENKGVYYFVKYVEDFKDKKVGIIGAGDSAFDWALDIIDVAKEVYIIQHNNIIKAKQDSVERFKSKNGKILLNKIVLSINGKDKVESIRIRDVQTNQEEDFPLDAVIIAIGNQIKREEFPSLKINKNAFGYIVDQYCQTSVPMVFAAGDCVAYEGNRFISIGFGQAALAVETIARLLRPNNFTVLH